MIASAIWVAISSVFLASRAAAQASPDSDVVVVVVAAGDSCASIAQRELGSRAAIGEIHRLNPELGPPPHSLIPGTRLSLPRRHRPNAEAELTVVHNDVQMRRPTDEGWQAARIHTALPRSSAVTTGEQSSAEVAFADRSRLQMREHTLVIIQGGSARLAPTAPTRASLERGALRSYLDRVSGTAHIATATSQTELGSGSALVTVGDDGSSRVVNHAGTSATVRAPGSAFAVRIPAGTGTIVRPGQAPASPMPLPDAPTWISDQAGRFIGITGQGATLHASWQAVPDARAYRIEVARNPDGTDLAAADEVDASHTSFEIHRIPMGVYYVSVATIDRNWLEGLPSPRRAMVVSEARLIPPGGTVAVERPYDPGDPSEPIGPPTVVPGTWIVAPPGFVCQVADGPQASLVTVPMPMDRSRPAVVRCADSAGHDVPAFDLSVFELVASIRGASEVTRGTVGELTLDVRSPVPLPDRLIATGPGTERGFANREGDHYELTLSVRTNAPETMTVLLGIPAGLEPVSIATVEVRTRDDTRLSVLRRAEPEATSGTVHSVQETMGRLSFPSVLGLRDEQQRAVSLWASLGVQGSTPESEELLTRASIGAQAQIASEPLWVGFSWSLDASGDHEVLERRGDGAVLGSFGWWLLDDSTWGLVLNASVLVPAAGGNDDIEAVRLLPSFEGSWRNDLLVLRTRQGAIFEVEGGGATLWASAYGLDVQLVDAFCMGVELDSSMGESDSGPAVALGLGPAMRLRAAFLDVSFGARFALTRDGRALMGPWTLVTALAARL